MMNVSPNGGMAPHAGLAMDGQAGHNSFKIAGLLNPIFDDGTLYYLCNTILTIERFAEEAADVTR